MSDEPKTAAVLTIHSPGLMTPEGRRDIAQWLRSQADFLDEYGADFTKGRFRARYRYKED